MMRVLKDGKTPARPTPDWLGRWMCPQCGREALVEDGDNLNELTAIGITVNTQITYRRTFWSGHEEVVNCDCPRCGYGKYVRPSDPRYRRNETWPSPGLRVRDPPPDKQEEYRRKYSWLKGHIGC